VIRASKVVHAGHWSGVATDAVVLGFDDRHRRRLAMQGERGLEFLLDLPEAVTLRHGDGLVLEDGRMVEVRAKPEPLLVVTAKDAHHLARLAWHLGNRHVPAAIEAARILIRPDHVLAEMLAGLGAEVVATEAPFDPEAGAYSQGHGGNGHHHDHHGHHHDHA
jgi:urease accessory protein